MRCWHAADMPETGTAGVNYEAAILKKISLQPPSFMREQLYFQD